MIQVDKVFIIAEAGVNHNGSLEMALALVDAAAASGADAVKFQTFDARKLVTATAVKAKYQLASTDQRESQRAMLEKLQLDAAAHRTLMNRCDDRGILFLSSPFDIESVDFLDRLGIPLFKIPSGEITNLPYLRHLGRSGKPIILSTGMSTLDEVESGLNVLQQAGTPLANLILLHCTTEYPTPFADVNLRAMKTLADRFGVRVGYSDHTQGIEVPIAAVALGATVIEKHFTLDCSLEGPDHRASLPPDQLTAMVTAIRNIELALGSSIKAPSPSELQNMAVARKSIVALRPIRHGEIFTTDNLTTKRPGTGISPMQWDEIIGKRAARDFQADEMIDP